MQRHLTAFETRTSTVPRSRPCPFMSTCSRFTVPASLSTANPFFWFTSTNTWGKIIQLKHRLFLHLYKMLHLIQHPSNFRGIFSGNSLIPVSYTHLRAHETDSY